MSVKQHENNDKSFNPTNHHIGLNVTITNIFGDEFSGELFALDIIKTKTIILRQFTHHLAHHIRFDEAHSDLTQNDSEHCNYVWIPTSQIQSVRLMKNSEKTESKKHSEILPQVDIQKSLKILEDNIQYYKENTLSHVGVGVTQYAQDVMDKIVNIIGGKDCSWENTTDISIYGGIVFSFSSKYTEYVVNDTNIIQDRVVFAKKMMDRALEYVGN